jgi:hypothetical protein
LISKILNAVKPYKNEQNNLNTVQQTTSNNNQDHFYFSLTQSGNYSTSPSKRNVAFISNSYYHFYYLAQALRRRNWDVITISLEDPKSLSSIYYHGEDINLYSPDPIEAKSKQLAFFQAAKGKYNLVHSANDFFLSFIQDNYGHEDPEDIIDWHSLGKKVAYTISGCMSGTLPSSVDKWSRMKNNHSVCDTCVWQDNEIVCSDPKSQSWIDKIGRHVDLTFAEALPAMDHIATKNVIREPTTMCLDPVVWHPELKVPNEHVLPRKDKEILVYHSVGNYESRTTDTGKNIKGSPAIITAIEKLKSEGHNINLIFKTQVANREVRFIQVQADIIVDQLNYGRYGATAREGMMLGKPVICYINDSEPDDSLKLQSIKECPLISSTETSIYSTLKNLIINEDMRIKIGNQSRAYALKWHSADACAERYEKIYDQLMNNQQVTHPERWSYYETTQIDVGEIPAAITPPILT